MPALEDLPHALRPSAGEPEGALVLLHGRGTSEQDVLGLLGVLDPHRRLVGACPRGPLELSPGGFHWYVVERVGHPHPETFAASFELLDGWLGALAEETGVPPGRTVLGGFSQGAVMAWAMTLGPGRPRPAGVLAMSGFVPRVPGFELDDSRLAGLPVNISHGTLDPVIGVDFGRDARDRAEAARAIVHYHETPVGHTLDPDVVREQIDWLAGVA